MQGGVQPECSVLHTNCCTAVHLFVGCRTTKKGYEEVHVPALKPKPYEDGE